MNGTVSRNANRICTPGSAIRSSLRSSIIWRSRLRSSSSSAPDVVQLSVASHTWYPAIRENKAASRRSSAPPWTPNRPPVSLVPDVALDQRLEQVADRRGERDRDAEQQALRAADPVAVVGAARVPDHQHADGDPDRQPLPGLVRRDPRRQLARAEGAAAEVGAGVPRERPEQHHEHERAAVVEPAQQHRVGEPEADPVDAEHGRGEAERDPLAQRARPGQEEQHGQERHEREQHVALVAERGGDHEPGDAEEARQPHRPHALEHREQLVDADEPERERARARTPRRRSR